MAIRKLSKADDIIEFITLFLMVLKTREPKKEAHNNYNEHFNATHTVVV